MHFAAADGFQVFALIFFLCFLFQVVQIQHGQVEQVFTPDMEKFFVGLVGQAELGILVFGEDGGGQFINQCFRKTHPPLHFFQFGEQGGIFFVCVFSVWLLDLCLMASWWCVFWGDSPDFAPVAAGFSSVIMDEWRFLQG